MMILNQPSLERIKELRDVLSRYSYQYHVLDQPSISDAVYDSLFTELKSIEADYPELITLDSPTQRVGNELIGGFKKLTHSSRMLSLNDVFDRVEVQAWVVRMDKLLPSTQHDFFADIKMDGLACALVYEDGILIQAVTRGDSFVGEDVTANVRTISNVPLRLRRAAGFEKFLEGRTEIRGEIVMLKKDFSTLNEKRRAAGESEFANPRNLAAGTIRQLDPKLVAARPLSFRSYDILRTEASDVPTNMFAYEALSALGVSRNTQARTFTNLDGVMKFIDEWSDKRLDLPFNTDGLVVKVNDRAQFAKLGIVGKQPRAAVAYKYAAEQATTIVKDIVISIGRTGAATPVAVFNPVVVAGTTVQHASLHNADEIERLDVRIGDTAIIYKAGDIIPKLESIVMELRPKHAVRFNFVAALKHQYPELSFIRHEGEVVYRVEGATGPLLLTKAVEHFASKGALDITTMGEKNVGALVSAGLVKDLADIYSITMSQLLLLDRFAEISAHKLVAAIADKRKPKIERFVYGLGIRHVGTQTAIDLVNTFGSIKNLQNASIDQLKDVDGVGEIVAESIAAWFADPDNEALMIKFAEQGVTPLFEKKTGPFSGMSFVVTGTLDSLSRDQAAEEIRTRGGMFQPAVGKDTTYLVAGGKVGESKLKKATTYGTTILTEKDFLNLLEK